LLGHLLVELGGLVDAFCDLLEELKHPRRGDYDYRVGVFVHGDRDLRQDIAERLLARQLLEHAEERLRRCVFEAEYTHFRLVVATLVPIPITMFFTLAMFFTLPFLMFPSFPLTMLFAFSALPRLAFVTFSIDFLSTVRPPIGPAAFGLGPYARGQDHNHSYCRQFCPYPSHDVFLCICRIVYVGSVSVTQSLYRRVQAEKQ
jgi:hypothetical protein